VLLRVFLFLHSIFLIFGVLEKKNLIRSRKNDILRGDGWWNERWLG
jgi:hypothetical protein